ncbi:11293_t:CDS:2, partial [Racocetra fulgida]
GTYLGTADTPSIIKTNHNGTINSTAATPYPKIFKETYNVKKLDFLVIGDWGYQGNGSGQRSVADAMKNWAKWNSSQFILNVGVAWIHIDTDPFAYYYNNLTDKNELKANLANMGFNNNDNIEERLNWIEDQLKAVSHIKWIFVVVGECSYTYYFPRLRSLLNKYRVTAYFAGHNHVLEIETTNNTSPVTYFTSGAGSRFDLEGCKGATWGAPGGTMGFLHVSIEDGCDQLYYEYVNATIMGQTPQVVKQGFVSFRITCAEIIGAEDVKNHTLEYSAELDST